MKFRIDYPTKQQHLTDEEIALWVDAIMEDRVEGLPERISNHGETCIHCKEKIVEISESAMKSQSPEIAEADKEFSRRYTRIPVIHLLTKLKVAATVIILIGVGTLTNYFLFTKKQDTSMLFAQNFAAYPDIITEKSASWPTDSEHQLLASGLGYYRAQKYDSALIVFEHLYQKNAENDTISFYFANTLLASKAKPKVAIEILSRLSEKETPFSESSQWYLSLALLKNKDHKGAKKHLIYLIKTSQHYKEKAELLLHELN